MAQEENKKEEEVEAEENAPSAYDFAQEVNPWGEFN